MHNAIDLVEKAFLQANRKHKQERDERNLKLQINMKLMILARSSSLYFKGPIATKSSSLYSKGLIVTDEQDQE
jgi:hypothetical protein